MDIEVRHPAPPDARAHVARLYAQAFDAKLRPGLGTGQRRLDLLAGQLDPDRVLCAVVEGTVRGVVGVHLDGAAALDPSLGALRDTYGAGAWWRALALLPLQRTPHPGELLLDGIAVDPALRGQGIGGRLLRAVDDLAAERGHRRVRLSVVDTNPRARALYERNGYVATGTRRVGALGRLYGGFGAVTEMVKTLPPATGGAVRA